MILLSTMKQKVFNHSATTTLIVYKLAKAQKRRSGRVFPKQFERA